MSTFTSKLTIITVCYNALNDLKQTVQSVSEQLKYYPHIEHLIVDGGSSDGTKEYLDTLNLPHVSYVSEKDKGIYDAMNKGIRLAKSKFLLFLNAGDYFVGNVLAKFSEEPCFLNVKYKILGKITINCPIKNYKQGLPCNHQGIIFEKKDVFYNLDYRIAADYEFYLQHNYQILPRLNSEGHVYYDNEGFSQINAKKRDQEISLIIKNHFGKFYYYLFLIKAEIKSIIKKTIQTLILKKR